MEGRYAIEIVEQAKQDRKAAVARVQQLSRVRAALSTLTELATEARFADLRAAAVAALGGFEESEAQNCLIEVLADDRDWHVRSGALHALARIGSEEAIQALEAALKDKAYGVREDARLLLEKAGHERESGSPTGSVHSKPQPRRQRYRL